MVCGCIAGSQHQLFTYDYRVDGHPYMLMLNEPTIVFPYCESMYCLGRGLSPDVDHKVVINGGYICDRKSPMVTLVIGL